MLLVHPLLIVCYAACAHVAVRISIQCTSNHTEKFEGGCLHVMYRGVQIAIAELNYCFAIL